MLNPGLTNSIVNTLTTQIKNASGTIINPSTEDTLLKVPGLSIPIFDYISAAYPDTVTEVYIYKSGGSGGTTVATVTVVYTDSTKENLSTLTKV